MGTDGEERGAKLPDLGRHGTGWVLLQFAGLFWVLLSPRWSGDWGDVLGGLAQLCGLFLAVAGGVTFVLSFRALGKSLTALPRPLESAQLVTAGPYEHARHPIYGAVAMVCFGWALLWNSLGGLVAAALTVGVLYFKSLKEEQWLVERYQGYPEYRARTRRFFPLPRGK